MPSSSLQRLLTGLQTPKVVDVAAKAMFDLNVEQLEWDRVHESVREGYRHSTRACLAAACREVSGWVTDRPDAG